MRIETRAWLHGVREMFPAFFHASDVLEVGDGYREAFGGNSRFTRVNALCGTYTDIVCPVTSMDLGRYFDVVMAPRIAWGPGEFAGAFARMIDHTMPGGLLLVVHEKHCDTTPFLDRFTRTDSGENRFWGRVA